MVKIKSKKKSLIQEWAMVLKKKGWKSVSELSFTSLVKVRPKTKEVLSFFAGEKKLNINNLADKENLISYSGIDLNESDWKKISTEIPAVCSKCIQIKEMDKNPIHSDLELQLYFLEKGMYKSLDITRKKNKKSILNSPIKDHYNGLHFTRYRELEMFDPRNKDNRQRIMDLDEWWDSIRLFGIENGLRAISEKANRATFLEYVHITEEQKEWYKNIPKKYKKNIPQIKYYALIYEMFYHDSPKIFKRLWSELKKQDTNKISYSYSFTLFHYLSAYCILKTAQGNNIFHGKYIDIVQFLREKDLLTNFDKISSNKLKNIIKSGLEAKRINWTEEFLEEFKHKISDIKNAANTIKYCDILLHFYKEKYEEALKLLNEFSLPADNWLKISSYYLHLIILNIMDCSDEADKMNISLREMVYRKDAIATPYVKSIKKGLSYVKRILKLPEGGASRQHYKGILNDLNNEVSFKEKSWLVILLKYKLKHL